MVAKFSTCKWQVAPSSGQIHNQIKWCQIMVKFIIDPIDSPPVLSEITQVMNLITGSILPLFYLWARVQPIWQNGQLRYTAQQIQETDGPHNESSLIGVGGRSRNGVLGARILKTWDSSRDQELIVRNLERWNMSEVIISGSQPLKQALMTQK